MWRFRWLVVALVGLVSACTFGFDPNAPAPDIGNGGSAPSGETATVTRIIDGDTIDVSLNGQEVRVRYLGVNTPERDETCYREATEANRLFVSGKTVTLVADDENTDQYGRLLRYIYVGNLFVNAAMVEQGYAEAVLYPPNDAHYNELLNLERQAKVANRGCHPTGIFNDGSDTR